MTEPVEPEVVPEPQPMPTEVAAAPVDPAPQGSEETEAATAPPPSGDPGEDPF